MNFTVLFSIILFLVLFGFVSSGKVKEIHVKTKAGRFRYGMGIFGKITVGIENMDNEGCRTRILNNPGDDFVPGRIDVFSSNRLLANCKDFDLGAEDTVSKFYLYHSGKDGLVAEWLRILLDNDKIIHCNDGYEVDNNEVHSLECVTTSPPLMNLVEEEENEEDDEVDLEQITSHSFNPWN